jgi:hypothetical protein
MSTALRCVVNGCLWAGAAFLAYCLLGILVVPLGLIDDFVAGEPGEAIVATPLAVFLCGLLVGMGFLIGVRRTLRGKALVRG